MKTANHLKQNWEKRMGIAIGLLKTEVMTNLFWQPLNILLEQAGF